MSNAATSDLVAIHNGVVPEPTVDFIMEGVITAVAPIHITSPDTHKDYQGVIRIPRMTAGGVVSLPAFKGETLKGNFRSHAVQLAIEVMRQRAGNSRLPLDLAWFYRLDLGGVKGSEKQKAEDTLLIEATCRRNPVVSLYGGAEPFWVGGKIEFGHAVARDPDAAGTIVGGARSDKMLRDPSLLAQFSEADQQAWLSYADVNAKMSVKKKGIKGLEDDLKKLRRQEKTESVLAQIAELEGQIKAEKGEVKEAKAGELLGETANRPLPGKNAVLPGAELDQKIRANRISLREFGYFLKTLELLSDRPRIGGHSGRGYGEFRAEWNLRARVRDADNRLPSFAEAGTIRLAETSLELPDNDIVRRALEAFDDLVKDPSVDFGYAS
jgi:hypothetical protein